MTDQSTTPHEEIDARILRMESQLPLSHYYTLNGDGCVIRYEAAVWLLEQIKQARAALKEIHALTCQDTDALTVTGIAERGLAGMSTATQMYEARRGAS